MTGMLQQCPSYLQQILGNRCEVVYDWSVLVKPRVSRNSAGADVVTLRDKDHEGLEVVFTYDGVEDGWRLAGIQVALFEPVSDSAGLRASSLRDLPLVRWQRAAKAALIESARRDMVGFFDDQAVAIRELGVGKLRYRQVFGDPTLARRFTQMKRLAQVARLYRRNVAEGRHDPAAAVAAELEVNASTARSWIHRARKAGILEPSPPKTTGGLVRKRK